jgi:hypothetical protein
MPRVIHLFDPRHDLDSAALRPAQSTDEHQLLPVTDDWISALRVGTRLRYTRGLFSLHVWSEPGLRAAVLSRGKWPIVLHVTRPMSPGAARLVRWLANHQSLQAKALDPMLRQHAIELGIADSRCGLHEPRIRNARRSVIDRDALRAALGFANDDRVALLPGAEVRGSGHLDALWAAVLVHVLDPRLRVLSWGAGPDTDRVRDRARRLGYPTMLRIATNRIPRVPFADLLAAADFLLVGDDEAPPLVSIAQALADDLPVLLPSAARFESLRGHPRAVFACGADPRSMAQLVHDWLERSSRNPHGAA